MNKIDALDVGLKVNDTFMVSEAVVRKTNTRPPKDFLAVTLAVGNSTLDGKFWNWPSTRQVPTAGRIYDVVGSIGEYVGKKQITIESIELSNNQDLTEFVPSVGIPQEVLWNDLCKYTDKIGNVKLKTIVQYCYGFYKEEILKGTAALRMHHVGLGGLALHTIEVARNVEAICLANLHLSVDISLALAGALLHDIGKVRTYQQEGALISMTHRGMFLDHIGIGIDILSRALDHLGAVYLPEIILLQHIISSHHGELEYGSPVTPKFMEAYIVNWADQISAKLTMINEANNKVTDGTQITEKIYACNNREHFTQEYISTLLTND